MVKLGDDCDFGSNVTVRFGDNRDLVSNVTVGLRSGVTVGLRDYREGLLMPTSGSYFLIDSLLLPMLRFGRGVDCNFVAVCWLNCYEPGSSIVQTLRAEVDNWSRCGTGVSSQYP